ncbi:hypothetical protein GGTG_10400 [Gaeumannomyces tritici R3-111a-1]|uniref:DUF2470 domain-containing protein n=1 Tax=Gaeumannomyces tritici (strain R3-111a-1) TaxID=644352 RepID=J3PA74_GAET3|nr:hypothetical protein GGTG_10400 [Gaeumannomyces tritici R3-111a-1]EJT71140.1 hypothetical protein GGTG_10400 [Gaeumannomyces tritici R3-111a-1]
MPASIPHAEHERTVAHMNKDHASDLSLYLRHFNGVPEPDAAGARLVSLDLRRMTIAAGPAGTTHHVRLRPALSSWDDRRAVLIDMAWVARAALTAPDLVPDLSAAGSSRSSSSAIRWPALVPDLLIAGAVGFYFASCALVYSGHLAPGSVAWDAVVASRFPGGPETFVWLVKLIAIPVILIHVVEAAVMYRSRLRRHGIAVVSLPGLFWLGWAFFEGLAAFRRFDRMVLQKKREILEREAKSH